MLSVPAREGFWRGMLPEAALLTLLLVRLLFSLPVFENPEVALYPDSAGYLDVARSLADVGRPEAVEGSATELIRPPGYPLFLALALGPSGEDYALVTLLQLALTGAVSVGLYALGRMSASRWEGLASAFVFALSPNVIVWSLAVLSEPSFSLLVVLSAISLVSYARTTKLWMSLLGGILLGWGALTRPIGLALVPFWAGLLFWHTVSGRKGWKKGVRVLLAFLIGFLILTVPWAYNNYRRWDHFTISTISTRNLSLYLAPLTLARAEGISLDEARERIPSNLIPLPGETWRGFEILMKYPIDYFWVHWGGTYILLTEALQPNIAHLLGRTYEGTGVVESLRHGDAAEAQERLQAALSNPGGKWMLLVPAIGLVYQASVYLLALLGSVRLARRGRMPRFLLATSLLAILIFTLVPGPVGNGRFRVPAEPFLSLLAGSGTTAVLMFVPQVFHRIGLTTLSASEERQATP